MKILIIPASHSWKGQKLASERIRCDWLLSYMDADKYNGSQSAEDYDAIIYQKALPVKEAVMLMNRKVQIYDAADPMWRFNDLSTIGAMLYAVDVVTVPTEGLKKDLFKFSRKRCEVIPDGHELSTYKQVKTHEDKKPTFVWFGFADNFEAVKPLLGNINGYDLLVVSEKDVGHGNFVKWEEETAHDNILRGDIVLNPVDPNSFKSDNKTVTAWALGLPVVRVEEDVEKFLCFEARAKEQKARLKTLDQFHVKHSAKRYMELIRSL